ncbi:hypothetical protein [Microlunatus sp. Y2014]|uniref:hypothetical protein n=1 Tax=Microlunatus sp. Y2014 TaxID=3418488 RepID=UPI003DA7878B
MTAAPAPLPTVSVSFGNQNAEEKLMEVRDRVQGFCDDLAAYRKPVYATATAMVVATAGMAFPLASACVAAYEGVILLAPKLIEWYNDVCQWVWAPFNVVDLANALQGPYDHATDCKQALIRQAMPADREWEGAGVDAYYGHIETHNAAAGDAESSVKSMKDTIHTAGMAGVVATFTALGALIAALIEAIVGLVALIPPATPGGAALIGIAITTFGATIAALIAFAQATGSAIEGLKNDLDGKLRSNNFPGGKWPQPTSHSVKSDIQDVEGWSYE